MGKKLKGVTLPALPKERFEFPEALSRECLLPLPMHELPRNFFEPKLQSIN